MGVNMLGLGTPITSLAPSQTWGLPHQSAIGINPLAAQQLYGQSPISIASTAFSPTPVPPLQQLHQILQIVPQQLQHLLQLQYLQQQQLQQLQQVVQLISAPLQQLQQHAQYIQQAQPLIGAGGAPGVTPWGVSPQIFGAQPSYVM